MTTDEKAPTTATTPGRNEVYSPRELDAALRQGEILSDVVEWLVDPTADPMDIIGREHAFCVIATQDCDLEQDYIERTRPRNPSNPRRTLFLSNILLLDAYSVATLESHHVNREMRDKIRGHRDSRFQLLQSAQSSEDLTGKGLPELVLDMKRVFSVPRDELYRQLARDDCQARRRTRLVSPYRDHLQNKLSFHIGRVGLPEQHYSE